MEVVGRDSQIVCVQEVVVEPKYSKSLRACTVDYQVGRTIEAVRDEE